ncbi:MAG: hypothetical protein WD042_12620 [Phycisphaeraceae bacterium]
MKTYLRKMGIAVAALGLFIGAAPALAGVWGTSALSELTSYRSVSSGYVKESSPTSTTWDSFRLEWVVTQQVDGSWKYVYTFKNMPYNCIYTWLEVTEGVTYCELDVNGYIKGPQWTTGYGATGWPTVSGSKVPLYGVKVDADNFVNGKLTIVTDRAPVYGNFFSTNGSKSVYNAGFLTWNGSEFTSTNKNYFIVRPDGTTPPPPDQPSGIPEPVTATLSLLGLGALATMTQRRPVR